MTDSILRDKCFKFSVRIVKLGQFLQSDKKDFVMSKQILRSGTAIGALTFEAAYGQSKTDFIHKLTIALKEAHETEYWLALLHETDYIDLKLHDSFRADLRELLAMLIASIKTARSNNE